MNMNQNRKTINKNEYWLDFFTDFLNGMIVCTIFFGHLPPFIILLYMNYNCMFIIHSTPTVLHFAYIMQCSHFGKQNKKILITKTL